MQGLLFSASQVGQWKAPIEVARDLWQEKILFLLIDSNGVCLLPPLNEFGLVDSPYQAGETPNANLAYPYDQLLGLSRRDLIVSHISKNVVPVAQDDDILTLSSDIRHFTIVSEVPKTRWKIGVSTAWRLAS